MSPAPFHAKEEQYDSGTYDQSPLKTNFLHRLPPPPSSTGSSPTITSDTVKTRSQEQQPPPRPLIIYTHSPKVIHTQPRDFMALVQKLTGFTRPPEDAQPTQRQASFEDNESTSVVTEEHGSSVNDISHVNSCFVDGGVGVPPPTYRAAPGFDPYFNPTSGFPGNLTDYLCTSSHQLPFYNPDSMFLNRNSLSSSLRVVKDYRDV
ncbi:hypothetical protein L1987_65204 [Smallanthus sonchifolius]|uniref:Uncharacterized protein n=1 Tax=Smallanthus sonchifolius TaxID=185202 RepID=A0ACB9BTN9_9ASTR|nr:hypothetical protein L1987_65204 [Smallanthus sonchifolius]